MVDAGKRVGAYHYGGYWQDVGTVESYWQTSLDLLSDKPGIDLYDRGWLIYTKSEERAPALIGAEASVTRSMVSHGCVIHGTVEHSILSPGVRVEAGAVVRDSIVMFDSVIGAARPSTARSSTRTASSAPGSGWATATTCGRIARSQSASLPGSRWSASARAVPGRVVIGRELPDRPERRRGGLRAPSQDPLRHDGDDHG